MIIQIDLNSDVILLAHGKYQVYEHFIFYLKNEKSSIQILTSNINSLL